MKKLTELFSKFDDIDKLIISECNIDLFWNTTYFEYNDNLYESLGIFNGCKEITKYLFSQLQKNIGETELDIDITGLKCENNFFDFCFFHIINDIKYINGEAGYISCDGHDDYNNEVRYDEENQKFKFIEISLFFDKDHIDNIYSLIMHELIHAYDDYIHIKKSGLDHSLYKSSQKRKYTIINPKNDSEDTLTQVFKDLMYHLDKSEQTAYIGQLNSEIKGTYKDIKDVISDLQKTNIYFNYKQIKLNFDTITKNKKYLNKFYDIYRSTYNSNKSNESIIKDITNKYNKFWKKFINHIYQIAKDHIINESIIIDMNKRIIKLELA